MGIIVLDSDIARAVATFATAIIATLLRVKVSVAVVVIVIHL
jgi:hypothetical protein